MGERSVGSFGNDTARDWVDSLRKTTDLDLVRETIQKITDSDDDYIEVSDAERAVAAIEVVARLKHRFGERNADSETADTWVESNAQFPPPDLVTLCSKTLDRILNPSCALYELWEESGEFQVWQNSVFDLKNRVCS